MQIKSEHCIRLLKARFQCLQGHRWVISSKRDLDVILQIIMCVCILHTLLIDHAVPQDWMVNNMEAKEDEEPEQHNNESANQCDQILAYMIEIR